MACPHHVAPKSWVWTFLVTNVHTGLSSEVFPTLVELYTIAALQGLVSLQKTQEFFTCSSTASFRFRRATLSESPDDLSHGARIH